MPAERTHDWPTSLPGSHGRISAYRYVLRKALDALLTARPHVPEELRPEIDASIEDARRELAVTNP